MNVPQSNSDLSFIADWLSIVGFVSSVITLIYGVGINRKVKRIQNKAIFNLNIDDKLAELAKSISKYTPGVNESEIRHELHRTEIILTMVKRMVGQSPDEIKQIDASILLTRKIKRNNIQLGNVPIATRKWWAIWAKSTMVDKDISNYYSTLVACHMILIDYAKNRKSNLVE